MLVNRTAPQTLVGQYQAMWRGNNGKYAVGGNAESVTCGVQ